MNANRWLVLVLRVEGILMLLALGAVFFPDSWMDAGHRLVGLGDYPQSPITEYLARSLSLFYAGVGVLVLVISSDLAHYRRLIVYMGVGHLVFAPLLAYVDLQAEVPLTWALSEALSTAIVGVVILVLVARVRP